MNERELWVVRVYDNKVERIERVAKGDATIVIARFREEFPAPTYKLVWVEDVT